MPKLLPSRIPCTLAPPSIPTLNATTSFTSPLHSTIQATSPSYQTAAGSLWCGLVYLTAVHTSSPLAFSRKLLQQAFFAPDGSPEVSPCGLGGFGSVRPIGSPRFAQLLVELGDLVGLPAFWSVDSHSLVWRTHPGRPPYLVST